MNIKKSTAEKTAVLFFCALLFFDAAVGVKDRERREEGHVVALCGVAAAPLPNDAQRRGFFKFLLDRLF